MTPAGDEDRWADLDPPEPEPEPEPDVTSDGRLVVASQDPQEAARLLEEQERAEEEARFEAALRQGRRLRRVKRELDAEEHAAAWKQPREFGTLADELAMADEPVSYRIDRVMPIGANVVLTAQYKTGKTTMVNHLVHCLVDGLPFLGEYRTTPVTGRVGLFNYEVTPSQYRRWFRDVGMKRPDRVAMLHLRGLRLPIVVRDIEKYVIDWLKRHEIEVWILDPFARALVGSGDENDNTEVGRFLDTLDVIKEQSGVTELLMPTHTGRAEFEPGKERARGATRLDDWPDVRWVLVKGDEDRRYLTCSGRDVDEAEMGLAYDTTTRGLTVAGAGRATTKRSGLRGELFAYIQTNPGLGVNELYDAFPNRKRELVAALHELTASGAVEVRQGPKRKHLHFARSQPPANDAPWMERDPGAGLF